MSDKQETPQDVPTPPRPAPEPTIPVPEGPAPDLNHIRQTPGGTKIRVLPLGCGHIRTRTHDYIRHGTVTLFAALSYLEGKLIYRTEQQHTHVEWLRFLKQIDREPPDDLDLHLIADNYCTHKHEKVVSWFAETPAIPHAFHSDIELLDEHGGTILRGPDAGLRARGEPSRAWRSWSKRSRPILPVGTNIRKP